jgi:pyrimidine-specific ribonucleoside hydrolase
MRAIALLLSRPEVSVHAILISDGSLAPSDAYPRIRALLHAFGRDSVPVACGPVTAELNPPWRAFNRQISWGESVNNSTCMMAAGALLPQSLHKAGDHITLLCLGPLTNLAPLVKDSTAMKKVERIIWYNPSVQPMQGFNYETDPKSADAVLSASVKVAMIANLDKPNVTFDTTLVRICGQAKTTQARLLAAVHAQPSVYERVQNGHFRLADELAVVYLLNPELFDINTGKGIWHRYDRDYDADGIREALSDLITGTYAQKGNVVFSRFPDERTLFAYDVRQVMDSAIRKYGREEWKANVMTDEFHGHLGVFSIVGAKMGILAREFFGVGPDELLVVTYAGLKPPYSCLNDGIQVSTGATLGMGTISVAPVDKTTPSAEFTHGRQTIRITLKPEYLAMVNADINEGIVKFGMMDDGYWKLVRRNAIRYWLEWDRNKIFTVEKVNN